MRQKRWRAIDLYSGVGGWSLGLRMAGIDVVASYEWWRPAIETNVTNGGLCVTSTDIRRMNLKHMPTQIDIVVGSPPCTEFSFSNRGGKGDLDEGLKDVIRFLEIIDFLKPRAWAMENVPRLATILDSELQPGGRLAQYAHLIPTARIFNMEHFGLPQRRRRCIVGNINFDLLSSYEASTSRRSLGEIVEALATEDVVDPLYGLKVPREQLFDHEYESVLNVEEERITRARKVAHPIYNQMPFPDDLTRSARTVTAVSTRVSRECIVIEFPPQSGQYRRLTLREQATLQGFPISFQFYGVTRREKQKLIGNAIPPLFTYYVAHAILQTPKMKVVNPSSTVGALNETVLPPPATSPETSGRQFPKSRAFQFALPSLRLKSGVRFELTNLSFSDRNLWGVRFVFGTSKSFHSIHPEENLLRALLKEAPEELADCVEPELETLRCFLKSADLANIQGLWARTGPGGTLPFTLLDRLDESGKRLASKLESHRMIGSAIVSKVVASGLGGGTDKLSGMQKVHRNGPIVLAGLLIGAIANREFNRQVKGAHAALPSVAAA